MLFSPTFLSDFNSNEHWQGWSFSIVFLYWLRPRPENKMAKELQKDSKLASCRKWELGGTIAWIVPDRARKSPSRWCGSGSSFSFKETSTCLLQVRWKLQPRFLSTCRGFGDPTFKNPDPIVSISKYKVVGRRNIEFIKQIGTKFATCSLNPFPRWSSLQTWRWLIWCAKWACCW